MSASSWDRRIARAEELAGTHPAAAELLKFYAQIGRFQKSVYEAIEQAPHPDTTLLGPYLAPLIDLVRRIGPPALVQAAGEPESEAHAFFGRALLQPYTESLAGRSHTLLGTSQSTCPFCGEKPQVGVLREEGDGGKRSLICSLCSTEWEFRRVLCPGCGEESLDKLPVYTASGLEYVRVEACDTCQTYIKSVDLTKNGLAVPVVDEMATIALNLWAEENGYRKLQLNLLGM
jgi:FdhE protein